MREQPGEELETTGTFDLARGQGELIANTRAGIRAEQLQTAPERLRKRSGLRELYREHYRMSTDGFVHVRNTAHNDSLSKSAESAEQRQRLQTSVRQAGIGHH